MDRHCPAGDHRSKLLSRTTSASATNGFCGGTRNGTEGRRRSPTRWADDVGGEHKAWTSVPVRRAPSLVCDGLEARPRTSGRYCWHDLFCGIDLDDALGAEGTLKQWASGIVGRFSDTYMEIVPERHRPEDLGSRISPRKSGGCKRRRRPNRNI
jgi:hypothetical protein